MTLSLTRRAALAAGALIVPGAASRPARAAAADWGAALVGLFDPATSAEDRANFWRDRMSEAGKQRWALETFLSDVQGVAALTGGVDLLEARDLSEGGRPRQAFRMRSRRRGTERWVRARPDREDPARLFDLMTLPAPAPYDREGPTGPVSRAELALEIERRVLYAVEKDDFSGAVLVSAPDGTPVWSGAYGLADTAAGRPNTVDTPFHLGSADKSFTALMIGALVREGRLAFDTSLAEVLPDYPNAAFARACQVQHLLTHSSGLGGLFDRPGWDGAKPFTRMAELLPVFAAEEPAFAPGTRADYSNEGFVVLGAVIEAVSGRSWYDLLAEQVYGPAGMTASAHFRGDEALDRKAIGETFPETDLLGFGPQVQRDVRQGYRGNSCGGGYSTVGDMTRYLRALRAGRLMPPAQLAEFVSQQPGGLPNYGRGFQVREAAPGRTLVGHGGGGPRSGIDGGHMIVWETGWAFSVIGNYDAPFAGEIGRDIGRWLAVQDA